MSFINMHSEINILLEQIPTDVFSSLQSFNIEKLTEIQAKSYAPILSGQNVIGVSETGSGKTLAYLLPLATLIRRKRDTLNQVLILAPSKELALQIYQVAAKLFTPLNLKCAVAFGGTGKRKQIAEIADGVHLIVGTPGRLLELYTENVFDLKHCRYFVLDEADRMMELGMGRQVGSFLEILPRKNQRLLFSATLPDKVTAFIDDFVDHPLIIRITHLAMTPESIDHQMVKCSGLEAKLKTMAYIFKTFNPQKIIIFVRSKNLIDSIKKSLSKNDVEVLEIHSNKDTNTRINAIAMFRQLDHAILLATDVSSRGLDIANVDVVINFNMPHSERDYIHRVGRTGRMGAKGQSISLIDSGDEAILSTFSKAMQAQISLLQVPAELNSFKPTKEESILQDRVKDSIKRRKDPDFKGGFHKKENVPKATFRSRKKK